MNKVKRSSNKYKKLIIIFIIIGSVISIISFCLWMFNRSGEKRGIKPERSNEYVYVYSNNLKNFMAIGKISSDGDANLVMPLDNKNQENPFSGMFGMKATVRITDENWGGWMFMRGYFNKGADEYGLDWGEHPNCGYDLTGAEELTFMACGENGGENVEFFFGGMGWQAETNEKTAVYPDSTNKLTTDVVTLTKEYQEYKIDLKNSDLSYISNGFGFVVASEYNNDDVTIYLDEIKIKAPSSPILSEEVSTELVVAIISAAAAVICALISAIGAYNKRKAT